MRGLAGPLGIAVRDDLNNLLSAQISDSTWPKINAITARYMLRQMQYLGGPSVKQVKAACNDLLAAIDNLENKWNEHTADPAIKAALSSGFFDLTVKSLIEDGRLFLRKQLRKCDDDDVVASNGPWAQWVRELANIAPEMRIRATGEGPERNADLSDFVKFLLRLQSELPVQMAEHEKNPGSEVSKSSFARAVRRALEDSSDN